MSLGILALAVACQGAPTPDKDTQQTAGSDTPTALDEGTISSENPPSTMVNRIAYITADGNISTINPNGSDPQRLTNTEFRVGSGGPILAQGSDSEVLYAWPTWSPDGTKLAASRIFAEGANADFSLEVMDVATGVSTRIYHNEPNTIPIAQGAPHYIYWSPDSQLLTFIASTQRELALFIASTDGTSAPSQIAAQGPIYFVWAGDGDAVLMHRGLELLYLRSNDMGAGLQGPRSLGPVGPGFRVPAISPDGNTMYYSDSVDGDEALYISDANVERSGVRQIMDLGPLSAFLLSPIQNELAQNELAVIDTDRPEAGVYDRLVVVSQDGTAHDQLVNEPLLAFFWAPDGQKLVYLVFDPDNRSFRWKLVNRSGGLPVELAEFIPSTEFLTLISFFDQYALSNSIWSPDSKSIVFSGNLRRESPQRNGGSPEGSKVYILDVEEGATPREIASSRIAFWSWN